MILIDIFKINNDWDIGHTRRYIAQESKKLGFNNTELGEISIVISELCTNFIKHNAVDGTLIFNILNEPDRAGIEITAQDRGPGIKDMDEAMKNGVSSKGTLGGGIGAIKRLMDSFEIYSNCDNSKYASFESNAIDGQSIGTLIILKKWVLTNAKLMDDDIKISILSRPYPGTAVNGDYYYIKKFKDRSIFAVIDGLGHGVEANSAARLVSQIINENTHKSIEDILLVANKGLLNTRGAVAGITLIDTLKNQFHYCAIGNIEFRYIFNGNTERLIPTNGILGAYSNNKVKVHTRIYEKGAIITMCTDGIINKWDFNSYSHIDFTNPTIFANSLLKDFSKDTDDATILIAVL